MSILLETSLGDITIDLDVDNSPKLCFNILKLAKARYYNQTLIYNVQPGRFCQMGDPRGDGTGGCSIYGLIDTLSGFDYTNEPTSTKSSRISSRRKQKLTLPDNDYDSLPELRVERSPKRFMKSTGKILSKEELKEKGHVVATEMGGVENTIGSQFLITIEGGSNKALDGITRNGHSRGSSSFGGNGNDGEDGDVEKKYYSLGRVVEDENDVLEKINGLYCDKGGRPYADVRIIRMHILDDPFDDHDDDDDLEGKMAMVMKKRKIVLMKEEDLPKEHAICARWISSSSPKYEKPKEEIVEERVSYKEAILDQGDEEAQRKKHEETLKKEDKSNAAILEMLGDIASADMKPPENVLFVCKLNPNTEDEDLTLIFSRFDQNAKAEIIRDSDTGDSLQYAFVEFDTKEACNEAYFKMNNALIDDRRIKVDFSQSVAKEWNRYTLTRRGNGRRGGGGGFYKGSRGHYKDDRQSFQPKPEKRYYGGYRKNGSSEILPREHKSHHHAPPANDDDGYERKKYHNSRDKSSDESESDEYSSDHYRRERKHRRRKESHKRRSKEHKRHSKDRSNDRDYGSSEDDESRYRSKDRHQKKRKHKHHKHKSKRRRSHEEEGRRRDKHSSSRKKHKRSSHRSRSRSSSSRSRSR